MASIIVTTNAFARASYPSLDKPKALNEEDEPKFRLQCMFSKSNDYDIPEVGVVDHHGYDLLDGLSQVCQEEFDFAINDYEDVALLKEEVGVQFPPGIKDGDKVIKKVDGKLVRGEYDENTQGYWLWGLTSREQPAVIDHEEDPIDPKKVYAGCHVRVQVEISAYYKGNSPIVAVDLLAVQYVYDDEPIAGGRPPRPDATKSFGRVEGGTAKTSDAKRMGRPGDNKAATRPGGRPSRPGSDDNDKPARPNRPDAAQRPSRPEPKQEPQRELVALGDHTIDELRSNYQMSDEEIVNEGYGEWREVESKPTRPNRPNRPSRPGADSKPARPAKPTPPSRPSKPSKPAIIMNDDCEWTYDELIAEGWTDDDIVNNGYGEFDYTNPDQ